MIMVNRGTEAFIGVIGSLNTFVTKRRIIDVNTKPEDRFEAIEKYLKSLLDTIKGLSEDEKTKLRKKYGSSGKNEWLRSFQNYVHNKHENYLPSELVEWLERQDKDLQEEGRKLVSAIEAHVKSTILDTLKDIFQDNWDVEIGSIKKECQSRATDEEEKHWKETGVRTRSKWTEQFTVTDYKKIIEKHWGKKPKTLPPFPEIFSIDVGSGFNSKAEKLKWISLFGSHRNNVAHSGTKEKGLSKKDVEFLQEVHKALHIELVD